MDNRFWLDFAQGAFSFLIGVYAWISRRHQATVDQIGSLESRMDRVEIEIKHAPTKEDFRLLADRVGQVHGDLRELSGSMSGLKRAVDIMNEHLLNRE